MSPEPRSWGRTVSTRAAGAALVVSLVAIVLALTPTVRAPPLPPLEAFGHALDPTGAPLPIGASLAAFINGVAYSNASAVIAANGSYAMEVAGNSYAGSASDTPSVKEGGDPGDLVVFTAGDLTTTASLFRQSARWEAGAVVSTDLQEANGSKEPALLKIDALVTRPADAGRQYVFLCNPAGGSDADLSRFYLQKDVPGSVDGPTLPLSGLVPTGTRYYTDLGSTSFLDIAGDALKLGWRNPGGSDAPAGGADVVVDRVEFNATTGGALSWEPGNTILSDAPAPGPAQQIHRSPSCADANSGSDFIVAAEGGRVLPPVVNLQTPAGGEDWTGGTAHPIAFTLSDATDPSLTVRIALSTDGGLSYPTTLDGPVVRPVGTQSFSWTVNPIDSTTARARVCATNSRSLTNCAASAADFAIDSTIPTVVALWPPSGAMDVRLNEPIRVLFSEGMARTPTEAAIAVAPSPGPLIFTWSAAGDTLVVDHPDFPTVTPFLATVGAAARDASDPGNSLAAAATSSFTTSDNRPPVATVTGPVGCINGGFNYLATWTMSDPETPTNQLVVFVNYTSSAAVGAIVGPATGAVSATWQPPTTLDAKDVRIQVQVFDPRGANRTVLGAPFEVDSTPPRVASSIPSTGTAGVPRTQAISITFSEPMNRTATEAAVQIVPAIPVVFAWSNTTLLVQHGPLAYNTTYTITVGTGARDDCTPGLPFAAPASIEFSTEANAAPSVQILTPAGGGAYRPGASLRITWNMSDDRTPASSLLVYVNYSSGSGANAITFGTGITNATWTIPALDASDVRVEVVVVDEGGLNGTAISSAFAVHPRGFAWTDYLWVAVVIAAIVVLVVILWFGRGRREKPSAVPRVPTPPVEPAPPAAPVSPPAPVSPGGKECPVCHTHVRADDRWCFFCGHEF